LEEYEPGGFHPVTVGQVLHDRYLIVDKLGHGGYSTVWLARDQRFPRYIALKVGTSEQGTVRREVIALQTLMEVSRPSHQWTRTWAHCDLVPRVLDEFELTGPNGRHACYASVPMQGSLKDVTWYSVFHVPTARALAAKLILNVALTHTLGICHGGEFHTSASSFQADCHHGYPSRQRTNRA
jgi:serine/threonine protein kinase